MQDHIVRAITKDGFLKATAICSTGIAERARQIHHTTPTATAALGRVLTAASMMGNMQKVENGTLTLQIKGGGPLGTLLAVSDAEGNVRGYVQNPGITLLEKYAGKLDVGAAVGTDGMLTVIRGILCPERADADGLCARCARRPRPDGQRGGRLSHSAAAGCAGRPHRPAGGRHPRRRRRDAHALRGSDAGGHAAPRAGRLRAGVPREYAGELSLLLVYTFTPEEISDLLKEI